MAAKRVHVSPTNLVIDGARIPGVLKVEMEMTPGDVVGGRLVVHILADVVEWSSAMVEPVPPLLCGDRADNYVCKRPAYHDGIHDSGTACWPNTSGEADVAVGEVEYTDGSRSTGVIYATADAVPEPDIRGSHGATGWVNLAD